MLIKLCAEDIKMLIATSHITVYTILYFLAELKMVMFSQN